MAGGSCGILARTSAALRGVDSLEARLTEGDGVHRVAVIIPALDEEEAIGLVLAEIPPGLADVLVVDNGSCDRTADVARAAGARVVRESPRGYGPASPPRIPPAQRAGRLGVLASTPRHPHPPTTRTRSPP